MLDLFTIFTKGGMVLWYFQGTILSLTPAVNALIKSVILQERGGVNVFNHDNLALKFKMDNEFEIIYVVVYQNIVQLSYIDKLLDQVSLAFRDQYKNELATGAFRKVNFGEYFQKILKAFEQESKKMAQLPKQMRPFQSKSDDKDPAAVSSPPPAVEVSDPDGDGHHGDADGHHGDADGHHGDGDDLPDSPRSSVLSRLTTRWSKGKTTKPGKRPSHNTKGSPKPTASGKKKNPTKWNDSVSKEEAASLDRSEQAHSNGSTLPTQEPKIDYSQVGGMKDVKPLDLSDAPPTPHTLSTKIESGGVFSFFKKLSSGKTISKEAMVPALEKMKEHLISKNVAAEISEKLCESVASKLDGKVIGTFSGVQSTVRSSMEESLIQILSPKRRIDILRDVSEAAAREKPYVITFCGVNGVGKSTNLAKIAYWLLENDHRVLIAACDTFRSGAVEQLRTHTQHLAVLCPQKDEEGLPNIYLFNQGYNKDAAGVAMEAIHYARTQGFGVVLVDTAGRMQDNEPLMRSLAKLVRVNCPDLILFVGEALVGNEAVDQLTKFNRALSDHAEPNSVHTIDGILLTKFDTIDDKVGAAISMTYATGQPIVFVGTGQRYTDIRSLNARAVVTMLLQ